ncbi:phosphatase PAP2 family protein [Nemorincola caseinilytica]|uniref:Phosphatase PAP2 family protein n=1 Tax=Nemorincola caseinilytica TaxID=2054315 RepID=A0ABP8NIY7_9BACT
MANALVEKILQVDHMVWGYLNVRWHNDVLDVVMPFIRNQWTWSPLYLFLLLFMPRRFGRNGWLWCATFLITFGIGDQVSASLLKPLFGRIRPCNDPYFSGIVHIIVPCGGGKSFPSSHATNHFALAIFTGITLGRFARWVWPAALLWATIVAYAQVYVGVHYPLDVFCGGILGVCIGMLTGTIFNRKLKLT